MERRRTPRFRFSKDITPILEGWDYVPDEISVRRIRGLDGRDKIQLRIDLGLMQMELDGRPDGLRPHGKESLLDYFESVVLEQLDRFGTDENFRLSEEDLANLQREAVQYYHRYISLLHLGDYDRVIRDTERNLRLFDFVARYAPSEEDKWAFNQYRPYVLMVRARAKSLRALEQKDYAAALSAIREARGLIENFYRSAGMEDELAESSEIRTLEEWEQQIERERPLTPRERLTRELEEAIRREEYEKAAKIRDQLRNLEQRNELG
ncbi:MAG: UvrB/UvrC motif-containing protein [candidate division KSB1 bacterium]|nr:UvrB/UvrC motif-containing protein [candidate division KSB1 bacterium]